LQNIIFHYYQLINTKQNVTQHRPWSSSKKVGTCLTGKTCRQ